MKRRHCLFLAPLLVPVLIYIYQRVPVGSTVLDLNHKISDREMVIALSRQIRRSPLCWRITVRSPGIVLPPQVRRSNEMSYNRVTKMLDYTNNVNTFETWSGVPVEAIHTIARTRGGHYSLYEYGAGRPDMVLRDG